MSKTDLTSPTDRDAGVRVINADAKAALASLEPNSIDSIVCDPPYEFNFTRLGDKNWDSTGIAFDVEMWGLALRALKPGGHLAAFGAARTHHRLTCAIEDAGFEVRDQIFVWMYGQGQAKGTNFEREVAKLDPAAADTARGYHSNLRPAYEPIVLARKPMEGGPAQNWLRYGTGGLNIDATRVPTADDRSRKPGDTKALTWKIQRGKDRSKSHPLGRWTPNIVLVHRPECTSDECDIYCPVAEVRARGLATRGRGEDAARFFPVFRYEPKAPQKERPNVDGVEHQTVKPLALIRWLVQLTTPERGTVLDMFAGSGTTGEAAQQLGHPAVLIELETDFIPLIHQRLERSAVR